MDRLSDEGITLRPSAGTMLVTHRSCLDGTGSALVFLWAGGRRDRILFRNPSGLVLGEGDIPSDVTEVWYADCCPSELRDPAAGRPFRVFDHHVSNMRSHGHDGRCVFDMVKSGTSLMAHVLGQLGDSNFPWMRSRKLLIEALEAYDLGRFDHEAGQRLADAAATYSQEELLDLMYRIGPTELLRSRDISSRAEAMASVRKLLSDSAERSTLYSTAVFPGDPTLVDCDVSTRVGIACSPIYWKNEVAQRILGSGRAELAIVIDVMGAMVSLRSLPGGPDCSVIAGLYGGGGHARAAGFKLKGSHGLLQTLSNQVFG